MEEIVKKLFEKRETLFAVIWIIAYVVGMSAIQSAAENAALAKGLLAGYGLVLSVVFSVFAVKNGLCGYFGMCAPKLSAREMLFYIPLIVTASVNLWFGVQLNHTPLESALNVVSMVFVGFLEEVIFRGMLFRAMCRTNVKAAFIVTSLTFGAGHIVNLVNNSGQSVTETLAQIAYACAIGFAFAAVAYFSGSIIPCIITHIVINSLSTFAAERAGAAFFATTLAIMAINVGYGVWLTVRGVKRAKAGA